MKQPPAADDAVFFAPMSVATLVFLVMAGSWATLIAVVRWPMGSPGLSPPVMAFLLAGAVMLAWLASTRRVMTGRWESQGLVLLVTLGVLFSPALEWVLGAAASPLIFAILALAWTFGLRVMARDLPRVPVWETFAAAAFGLALGVEYFLLVNTKGYATVFSPEQTAFGIQHRDTLYQAALAAMLGNFATPSTGLDGLVPIHYHLLSNALMGVTSRWMGIPTIDGYYLVSQVVGIPLLFFSLTAASFSLSRTRQPKAGALLVAILPLATLVTFEIWDWGSYLVSESYAHALTILLFAVPLVTEVHEARGTRAALIRWTALALVGVALVLAKSSVGAVFATGVLYMGARWYGLFSLRLVVCAAVTVLVLWLGVKVTVGPQYSNESLWGPWHFVSAYRDAAWPNIVAIVAALVVASLAWLQPGQSRRQRLTIEVLAVMIMASLGSGLLLQIGAGGAYYFLNVGVWMGIAVAIGAVVLPEIDRRGWAGAASAVALTAGVVALLAHAQRLHPGPEFFALVSRMRTLALEKSSGPVASTPAVSLAEIVSLNPALRDVADAVKRTPGGRMAAGVLRVAAATPGRLAVFVPPGNTTFWQLHTLCTAQPFFIPALTGLPLIKGLPPDGVHCPLPVDTGFGYAAYSESSRSTYMSDDALCTTLRTQGFDRAVVLETSEKVRSVTCR